MKKVFAVMLLFLPFVQASAQIRTDGCYQSEVITVEGLDWYGYFYFYQDGSACYEIDMKGNPPPDPCTGIFGAGNYEMKGNTVHITLTDSDNKFRSYDGTISQNQLKVHSTDAGSPEEIYNFIKH